MIGVSTRRDLAEWVNRVPRAISSNLSYPGFINWMAQQPAWDIGIAPLTDTPLNCGKSAIKAMDYGALGLAVVASDVAAYDDTLTDGVTGLLVANTESVWFDALSRLMRDPALRLGLARGARAAFAERWTLAAQTELRQAAWGDVVASKPVRQQGTPEVLGGKEERQVWYQSSSDVSRATSGAIPPFGTGCTPRGYPRARSTSAPRR